MASELANKIAECVDYVIVNQLESYIWRDLLTDGSEWKISVAPRDTTFNQFDIIIKNRSAGTEQ